MRRLRLYSNCKITSGYVRDVIVDLEREKFFFVPKGLTLMLSKGFDVTEFEAYKEVILNYESFLIENRLAFYPNFLFQGDPFQNCNDSFVKISNCILVVKDENEPNSLMQITNLLDTAGCQALLILLEDASQNVNEILKSFSESKIRSIELVVPYRENYLDTLSDDYELNARISLVTFYNAPSEKYLKLGDYKQIFVQLLPKTLSELLFLKVRPEHFRCNIPFYLESLQGNPYYLKKIIVDMKGNVYEDLVSNRVSGTVATLFPADSEFEFIQPEFTRILKSEIDICKNCEFQNICPDNRIPQRKQDGTWYHTSECRYNPYIGKWEGEEGYQDLKKSGVVSTATEFTIDEEILACAIEAAWSDDQRLS